MAITEKGARFGTVGGAGLEMKVENALQGMLNGGREEVRKKGGRVATFVLYKDAKGEEATPLDSLCGGRVTVAMEVMDPMPHILTPGEGTLAVQLQLCAIPSGGRTVSSTCAQNMLMAIGFRSLASCTPARSRNSSMVRTRNLWLGSPMCSYSGTTGQSTKRYCWA